MSNLRRYPSQGHPVFLTLVCRDRAPHLGTDVAKALFLDILRELKLERPFRLHGHVLLDDHAHLLLSDDDFSTLVQRLKLRFTRRLKSPGATSLWQPRFWDHVIRDADDLARHLDYIHYNPVKHGQSPCAADYPWSSLRAHIERGRYPANWGNSGTPEQLAGMELE
jgi:putative transposase